jgi:hypothetical protein
MGMMLKQPDETLSEYLARINSAIETMMPELFASDELKSFYELMNTQLDFTTKRIGFVAY